MHTRNVLLEPVLGVLLLFNSLVDGEDEVCGLSDRRRLGPFALGQVVAVSLVTGLGAVGARDSSLVYLAGLWVEGDFR